MIMMGFDRLCAVQLQGSGFIDYAKYKGLIDYAKYKGLIDYAKWCLINYA